MSYEPVRGTVPFRVIELTEAHRVAWCSIQQGWVDTGDKVHHDGTS